MSNNNNNLLIANQIGIENGQNNEVKNYFKNNQTTQNNINGNDRFNFGRNDDREKKGVKISYNLANEDGNGINGINNNLCNKITNNINYSQMNESNANNNRKTEILLDENSIGQHRNESTQKENFENQKMGSNTMEEHNSDQDNYTLIKLISNKVIKDLENKSDNHNKSGRNVIFNNDNPTDTEIRLNKEYLNKKDKSQENNRKDNPTEIIERIILQILK